MDPFAWTPHVEVDFVVTMVLGHRCADGEICWHASSYLESKGMFGWMVSQEAADIPMQ
jgi:hypothetical protein